MIGVGEGGRERIEKDTRSFDECYIVLLEIRVRRNLAETLTLFLEAASPSEVLRRTGLTEERADGASEGLGHL